MEQCLASVPVGAQARVVRIAPETAERLHRMAREGLMPGRSIRVVGQHDGASRVRFEDDTTVRVTPEDAVAVWVDLV